MTRISRSAQTNNLPSADALNTFLGIVVNRLDRKVIESGGEARWNSIEVHFEQRGGELLLTASVDVDGAVNEVAEGDLP